jgi:NitT/TauT family transport system permease protein
MSRKHAHKFLPLILPICFGGLAIVLWEAVCHIFNVPTYQLPTPSIILLQIETNPTYLMGHLGATFGEAILGLLLAASVGFGLGCLFVSLKPLERMALPYFVASQSIPIVAVAPLFILWFGNGMQSKIAMAALMCFFPITVNTCRGLRSVSQEQLDLFRMHAAWNGKFSPNLGFPLPPVRYSPVFGFPQHSQ